MDKRAFQKVNENLNWISIFNETRSAIQTALSSTIDFHFLNSSPFLPCQLFVNILSSKRDPRLLAKNSFFPYKELLLRKLDDNHLIEIIFLKNFSF